MFEGALTGQVALVTGGSKGIGRATVLALAEAGADVALSYSAQADARAGHPGIADSTADEARALGVRALTLEADVADPASAEVMVDSTIKGLGRLDILVNNAGIARDNLAIRMSDAEWDLVIAIDLSAAFHVSRAALKRMFRQRSGRIINVSSIAGIMGNPGQANYSAAKAGLIGLTKTLAREMGPQGDHRQRRGPGLHRDRHDRGAWRQGPQLGPRRHPPGPGRQGRGGGRRDPLPRPPRGRLHHRVRPPDRWRHGGMTITGGRPPG